MLAYSWDSLELVGLMETGKIHWTGPSEFLAQVLLREVHRIQRRGMSQQYVDVEEVSGSPRGRISFAESLKSRASRTLTLHIHTSELSSDVPLNQVAKATALLLAQRAELPRTLRQQLLGLVSSMRDIGTHRLTGDLLRRTVITRESRHYRLVYQVALLTFLSGLADEDGVARMFAGIEADERKLRLLFQRFVRRFLEREQTDYEVGAPQLAWALRPALDIGVGLPRMQTDVVLRSKEWVVVIDTKFTPSMFDRYYEKESVRSDHLYQLWAYLSHIDSGGRAKCGMLLYPQVGASPTNLAWRGSDAVVRVRTVNLGLDWPQLKSELLSLLLATPLDGFGS